MGPKGTKVSINLSFYKMAWIKKCLPLNVFKAYLNFSFPPPLHFLSPASCISIATEFLVRKKGSLVLLINEVYVLFTPFSLVLGFIVVWHVCKYVASKIASYSSYKL